MNACTVQYCTVLYCTVTEGARHSERDSGRQIVAKNSASKGRGGWGWVNRRHPQTIADDPGRKRERAVLC